MGKSINLKKLFNFLIQVVVKFQIRGDVKIQLPRPQSQSPPAATEGYDIHTWNFLIIIDNELILM